ncbi:hypothetical protein [Raoultella planticola]|uniref:hypothetical protein n=1 Tax=Raoultella planticola TaxID=575 RepID=UPI003525FE53
MTDLLKSLTAEARKLADEAKTLEIIAGKNLLSFEASELLDSLRQRLNVIGYQIDEVRAAMKASAAEEATTLERQEVKKSPRASHISAGERAKRQAVRRGATLYRGAI